MRGGEASVLQHAGLLVPGTALTAFGSRTAKKTTKHTAPMPNIKRVRTSFILAPMRFPFRTGSAHQLGRLIAIRPGGTGDITETDYRLWRFAPTPDVPSPLIVDDLVYLFRENSVLICLDAKTGKKQYEHRLNSSENNRASPVYAAGKIYFCARNGTINVVVPGRKFEQVWESSLDDSMTSSPAISNGRIYLRTNSALWAFGPK